MTKRIRVINDRERLFIGQKMMLLRHLEIYPKGILSEVMDTWDLWQVLTELLPDPEIKNAILKRDGKLVIRPDSGNPVDIICGKKPDFIDFDNLDENSDWESFHHFIYEEYANDIENKLVKLEGNIYELGDFEGFIKDYGWDNGLSEVIRGIKEMKDNRLLKEVDLPKLNPNEEKGVIELLWDVFGGITNSQGYKVLDPHIGAIYGDSITLDRAEQICERLKAKGFASTNITIGIGSYSYQYNTRDTFGFAIKATYGEVTHHDKDVALASNGTEYKEVVERREIWKDPITDDGTKKSAKGLLMVQEVMSPDSLGKLHHTSYKLKDQCTKEEEESGALETVFEDGVIVKEVSLDEIRKRLTL